MSFYQKLVFIFVLFYVSLFLIFYSNEDQPDQTTESVLPLRSLSLIQTHYYQIVNESSNANECIVRNYPFTEEEYERIFAFKEYGRCPKYDDIHSSLKNRVYNVKCKNP